MGDTRRPVSNTDLLMNIAADDFHIAESKILENINLLTQKDENHRSILHWAAVLGKERLVEFLLKFRECAFDEPDDSGATPLLLATLKGSLQICKWLVEKGANVNHQNSNGHNAVKYAGSKNRKELLIYLLDSGGDVNASDHIGDTPLHRVASMELSECLLVLLEHPVASRQININIQNKQGNTPLHLACENVDPTCAFILIDHGASVETLNKSKQSPLDVCKPVMRRQILNKLNNT